MDDGSPIAKMRVLCAGCGANLDYSASDRALKCQYCGAVTEIASPNEEVDTLPEQVIPLTVSETALVDSVYEHLASGDMTPDHLLEHATFLKKERFYVPVYLFRGRYDATWTATFGYDRTEHYTVYENRTENGHSRQVPVSRTRTVTDWRPVNGSDSGLFGVTAYGGKSLTEASLPLLPLVEKNEYLDLAVDYNDRYTTGLRVEEVAQEAEAAWAARADDKLTAVIDAGVKGHAQGDRQRDWHWTCQYKKHNQIVLAPVCHVVYEFEGKQYNVWVNGTNTEDYVSDPLPVDQKRQSAIALAAVPLVISVVTGGFAWYKLDVSYGMPVLAVGLSAAYYAMRHSAFVNYSKKLRQSILAGRKAANSNTQGLSEVDRAALLSSMQRPKKPFLADVANDKFVLPVVYAMALLLPLAHTVGDWFGHRQASPVAQSAVPAQEAAPVQPVAQTAPAEVVQQAPQAASEVAVSVAASAPRDEPTAGTQQAATEQTQPAAAATHEWQPLIHLVGRVKANDWAGAEQAYQTLKSAPPTVQEGDRRASRAANTEGLAALRNNNGSAAIAAFDRGLKADPSDVEVANNLGYALLTTGRSDDAVKVLGNLLMRVPDRASAWSNLSEATSGDPATAQAALKLAVRFTSNRERLVGMLQQNAGSHPNAQFRAVIAAVLQQLDSVPANPADVSMRRTQTSAPAPAPTVAPAADELAGAIRQMLDEGESCLKRKQYGCAMTAANNVLKLRPSNADAQRLRSLAESAQADAMRSIEIK